jgi:hypothetical protein
MLFFKRQPKGQLSNKIDHCSSQKEREQVMVPELTGELGLMAEVTSKKPQ